MHYDQHEVDKFNNLAHHWWNLDGEFKTLHLVNPVRMKFIQNHANLAGKMVIDVGCGGGILSESLAAAGSIVTGIDLAPQSIEVADLHLYESELNVKYECIDVERKASLMPEQFDVLTCMEMLEHVPNPEIIIENCAKLLKPGGSAFFSTLNRNLKSYLLGVLAAEYIMRIIPKGTHEYAKFIKPSELRNMLTKYGLELINIKGLDYNPFTQKASLVNNTQINYIIACRKV